MTKSTAFKAGFAACAVAAVSLVTYVSHLALKEFQPKLEERAMATAKSWVKEVFFEDNLFTQPVYLTMYYSDETDGHKYQTWKLTLTGRDSVHGEIEDIVTGNKGLVNGYWRASTLNLSYASAASDRPGLGSLVLRPMHPGLAEKAITYAGLAVVHECECKDNSVTTNGPMLMIPAVLTSERVLPSNISSAFFIKPPVKPDIVWPADIQQTASNQKH